MSDMESLYVCRFSNGHIKVGRSVEPMSRIAQHAERVGCMGVELVEHFIAECAGPAGEREQGLINQCVEAAAERFKSEWFSGLDYLAVCKWATKWANVLNADEERSQSMWPAVIREIRASGLTQCEIAERCNCNQTSISKLLTGYAKEPLYGLGTKLLALRKVREALAANADQQQARA